MYFCYKRAYYRRGSLPPYRGTELTTARESGALAVVSPFWLGTPSPVSRNKTLSSAGRGWRYRLSPSVTKMVLAAGDFNSHHPWLGLLCPSNVAGRQLYTSFENSEHVHLLNDVCSHTYIRHGRLDLAFASSCLSPAPAWSLHPTLTSDHFGIVLEIAIRLVPPPHRPLRFNMRQANWPGKLFKDTGGDLLRDADLDLPLDECALNVCNIILQTAHRAIPCVKPTLEDTETHGYTVPE